jgi:aminoglycoside phosphotransferase family enzyme
MAFVVNPHLSKKVTKDTTESTFVIEYELPSKPARLFFAYQQTDISNEVVIKILRRYEDPRYKLKTLAKRQECQLEALQWNTKFANDIYIGLAPVLKRNDKSILLGGIIKDVEKARNYLDSRYEYALIMKRLPTNRQLNFLLDHGCKADHKYYASLLTQYIVKLHQALLRMPSNEAKQWGNFEKLSIKLRENLALVDPLFSRKLKAPFSSYTKLENFLFKWFHQWFHLRRLQKTFNYLKESFSRMIDEGQYQEMFQQRIQNNYIHRCHGDLKAPNIWIDGDNTIHLLDAIDFNPAFCNIDILSDFAMLVIDIQVRTMSSKLADDMIEEYLREMKQTGIVSRAVLAYYLAEKAYVGAAISIMYDDAPDLGQSYLKIAKERMESLIHLQTGKSMSLQRSISDISSEWSNEFGSVGETNFGVEQVATI